MLDLEEVAEDLFFRREKIFDVCSQMNDINKALKDGFLMLEDDDRGIDN